MPHEEFAWSRHLEWCLHPDRVDQRWEVVDGVPVERPAAAGKINGFLVTSLWTELTLYARPRGEMVIELGSVPLPNGDVRLVTLTYVTRLRNGPPVAPRCILHVDVATDHDTPESVASRGASIPAGKCPFWWIDPRARTVTIYRVDEPPRILGLADVLTHEEMPGFACTVSELFQAQPV